MATLETDFILMTLVIFVPSVFALGLLFFPKGSQEWMRWWALLGTAVTFVLSLIIFIDYDRLLDADGKVGANKPRHGRAASLEGRADDAQSRAGSDEAPDSKDYVARHPWIKRFNIEYYVGVDGISLPLIILTTGLCFLAIIASWKIERYVKGYLMLFLLLETGMIGTFLALDFFLFYIFWEVMLLPMYFLIGVWGGPRREYAAIKFFLYTLLGSVFILVGLLGFYFTDIQDFVNPTAIPKTSSMVEYYGANSTRPAPAPPVANSFDLLALQKAGRAAFLKLAGREGDIEVVRIEDSIQPNIDPTAGKTKDGKAVTIISVLKNVTEKPTADKSVRAVILKRLADLPEKERAEVKKRLDQPFFTKTFQYAMFILLFIGFAIKVPIFPFHTWLPDAHVEAPTPISMILAGVLLKLGGYGIIRIAYPICPWAAEELAWYVCLLGVINIVYGALAAMAQTDFKKLVAYSSVSHMGYVILGVGAWGAGSNSQYWEWGMNGAMFQMMAHGITSAGMFFLVGVIYDRAHHRNLDNFRGLMEPMPLYGGVAAIIFFAGLGLPGLCGFVGEFMVVLSTWSFSPVFSILAGLTVVLTAAYILWTIQRVYLGTNPAYKDYTDMTWREVLCIAPLILLAVLLGVAPQWSLMSWMQPSVSGLVETLAKLGKG